MPRSLRSSGVASPAFFEGDDDADFAFDQAEQAADDQASVAEEAPSPASLPAAAGGDGEFGDGGANVLQTAERRVIQNASIASIENLGDVRQKTLREGGDEIFPGLPESVVVRDPDVPDTRVLIFLRGDDDGSDTALTASLAGVFGTLGGIVLILAAYRYGRRRDE